MDALSLLSLSNIGASSNQKRKKYFGHKVPSNHHPFGPTLTNWFFIEGIIIKIPTCSLVLLLEIGINKHLINYEIFQV
jgi:hypothetical protein